MNGQFTRVNGHFEFSIDVPALPRKHQMLAEMRNSPRGLIVPKGAEHILGCTPFNFHRVPQSKRAALVPASVMLADGLDKNSPAFTAPEQYNARRPNPTVASWLEDRGYQPISHEYLFFLAHALATSEGINIAHHDARLRLVNSPEPDDQSLFPVKIDHTDLASVIWGSGGSDHNRIYAFEPRGIEVTEVFGHIRSRHRRLPNYLPKKQGRGLIQYHSAFALGKNAEHWCLFPAKPMQVRKVLCENSFYLVGMN